ncbi:hypothetical protein ZIOFF_011398 [Zingiber officinale]|uniref:Myb/SANT-like domain-containing protein n=1 Tax=Zingiber officinale TaxID=94328 RepID=A0A8J5LZN2_ZINOF|nr:hypothetical protein ZIOFF_011398 [Zingiber officinale]
MDGVMLEVLREQKSKGQKEDRAFSAEAYRKVVEEINDKFSLNINKTKVMNRLKTLKEQMVLAKEIEFKSGIGWNDSSKTFEASLEVWKSLIKGVRLSSADTATADNDQLLAISDSNPMPYRAPFLMFQACALRVSIQLKLAPIRSLYSAFSGKALTISNGVTQSNTRDACQLLDEMPLPDSKTCNKRISFALAATIKFAAGVTVFLDMGLTEAIHGFAMKTGYVVFTAVQNAMIDIFENIIFRRSMEAAAKAKTNGTTTLSVKAIVFEVEDREKIGGSAYGGKRDICCTADLAKLGSCTEGTIIYHHSDINPDRPQVLSASFKVDDLESKLPSKTLHIMKTRMYNLYFIYCDPIWKNPTGYLPGRMEPLIKLYEFMSLAFLILAVYWFSQYARSWTEVIHCRTVQHFLTSKVALLGETCFLSSEILGLVENVGTISDVSGKPILILALPVAILDAMLIIWIFISMLKTLKKLQRNSFVSSS